MTRRGDYKFGEKADRADPCLNLVASDCGREGGVCEAASGRETGSPRCGSVRAIRRGHIYRGRHSLCGLPSRADTRAGNYRNSRAIGHPFYHPAARARVLICSPIGAIQFPLPVPNIRTIDVTDLTAEAVRSCPDSGDDFISLDKKSQCEYSVYDARAAGRTPLHLQRRARFPRAFSRRVCRHPVSKAAFTGGMRSLSLSLSLSLSFSLSFIWPSLRTASCQINCQPDEGREAETGVMRWQPEGGF